MSKICQYLCALQLSISVVTGSFPRENDWIPIRKMSVSTARGAGFIQIYRPSFGNQYDTPDRTESRCISTLPRVMWRDKNPTLRTILSTASQPPESTEIDERATIFVGNLPWALDSYGLRKLFEPYGKIRIAQISWDDRTDRSRFECSPSPTTHTDRPAPNPPHAHSAPPHLRFHLSPRSRAPHAHSLPHRHHPAARGGAQPPWRGAASRGRAWAA
jgi:hypothetical protein